MLVFAFYMVAILIVLSICAAVADLLGHFFPEWLADEPEHAAADRSSEAMSPTRGTGSSGS